MRVFWCRFVEGYTVFNLHRVSFLFAVFFMVSACVSTPSSPTIGMPSGINPHYKVGTPYQIAGITYHPAVDQAYQEEGTASWYGPNFHGKPTANGELFDMNALTAAHRTLPMPSIVEVTNLENGRKLRVRVNDRGPFAHNRIIDLSREAARRLGFERQGVAQVHVRYVRDASLELALTRLNDRAGISRLERSLNNQRLASGRPSPQRDINRTRSAQSDTRTSDPLGGLIADASKAPIPPTLKPNSISDILRFREHQPRQRSHFIQVGAYSDLNRAEQVKLRLSTIDPAHVEPVSSSLNRTAYKVFLGPFEDLQYAEVRLMHIVEAGYLDAWIVTK